MQVNFLTPAKNRAMLKNEIQGEQLKPKRKLFRRRSLFFSFELLDL